MMQELLMVLSGLNWLDWSIIVIILLSTLFSFTRGFFREALSLVIWLIAVVVSFTFYPNMAVLLEGHIASPSLRQVSAIASLFVLCLLMGALFSFLIGQLIRLSGLGAFDRLLGMVFGFLRGVVLVVVLLMLMRKVLPVQQEIWWQGSVLAPHVLLMESSIMLMVIHVRDWIFPLFKNLF